MLHALKGKRPHERGAALEQVYPVEAGNQRLASCDWPAAKGAIRRRSRREQKSGEVELWIKDTPKPATVKRQPTGIGSVEG